MKPFHLTCFAALLTSIVGADVLAVSNRGDNTLQLFDTEKRTELKSISIGVGAHEFALSPDGRTLVGACYGSGPRHKTPDNRLVVIDLKELGEPKLVDLGENPRPNDMRFMGADRLLVTSEVKQTLLVVDTTNWTVERSVPFDEPGGHMVAVSPDFKTAFVPCVPTGKVALVDLESEKSTALRRQIKVGKGAEGVDLAPDGKSLWVASHHASEIAIIDTETLEVAQTLQADGAPFRVRFTPNGKAVMVSHVAASEIRVYDAVKRAELGRVSLAGGSPSCIAVSADSRFGFAVCGPIQKIAMIDLASLEVVHWFETGPEPDAVAVSPLKL